MPREKEGFREQLQRLSDRYPGLEAINIKELAKITGVHADTLKADTTLVKKKIGGKTGPVVVPLVSLARWFCDNSYRHG